MPTTLLQALLREAEDVRRHLMFALLLSAAANTGILIIINAASASATKGNGDLRLLALFVVALALYVVGLRFTFAVATRMFEGLLGKIRLRIEEGVARSEVLTLRELGGERILRSLAQDTVIISESQGLIVAGAHSALMVVMTGIYVLSISMPAFLVILVVISAGAAVYLARTDDFARLAAKTAQKETELISQFTDLVAGAQEIKLNQARRDALLDQGRTIGEELVAVRIEATDLYNQNAVFSQTFFYVLLGVIVFVLPVMVGGVASQAPQLLAAVLFIFGPLSTVITAIPSINRADHAAASLLSLDDEIGQAAMPSAGAAGDLGAAHVQPLPITASIECRGLEFRYPGEGGDAFAVGPIDLKVARGDLTMFVGGNGSGKSTLLKVLAGLYAPTAGRVLVDGKLLPPDGRERLRETFGAVFSDFHLFPKLYGIDVEGDAVLKHLEGMQLLDKVGFSHNAFSTLDLSTGQRKRLALATTLLEDRPVLIFDEWAAEQDPEFRAHFYEELLPRLKREGKTLLVATHDDRYFGLADVVVKMELGRIESVRRRKATS